MCHHLDSLAGDGFQEIDAGQPTTPARPGQGTPMLAELLPYALIGLAIGGVYAAFVHFGGWK